MSASWYVQNGSDVIGPVTTELLVAGIRAGRIPLMSNVCPVGGSAWVPLAERPEFAAAIRQSAPPPPSPPIAPAGAVMTPAPLSADMTGEKIDVPGVISVIVVVLGAAILATALSAPAYWAVAASAIFVYSDARSNAVSDSSRGFRKASPVIWLWAVSIMAIIALPWYFVVRNKRRTRHGGNAFFALVIVSAFAFVAILGRSALPALGLQELPECDALEVTALATNALQDAPAFNGMPMNFRISTPGEVRFRSDPPRRVCRAALSSKLGNETIFYAVEWQQRKNNLIWVQILGSEDDGR